MRILVIGAGGQLGLELMRSPHIPASGPALGRTGLGHADLDIGDRAAVLDLLGDAGQRFAAVVNCAAYTAVDDAETDRDAAFRVNRDGPANLAEACARAGLPLIHVSTDYVFDGEKAGAYVEDDAVHPLNVYGESKAAGEQALRERHERHLILRTSWLYGAQGRNFVKTMLRLGATQAELRIVDDQRGSPTAAPDLAAAILDLVAGAAGERPDLEEPWGTYHCCNAGATSWFGFAAAIFAGAPAAPRLVPVTTAEFPRPARRPRNSRLDCGRLARRFGITLRPWQDALADVLRQLEATTGGVAQ